MLTFGNQYGNNSCYVETAPSSDIFHPIEMKYGEFVSFYGNKCRHFNRKNDTGISRVSIDFRIMPISKYNPDYDKESLHTKRKFLLGGYYTKIKGTYSLPWRNSTKKFHYPNNNEILVTNKTCLLTPYTFPLNTNGIPYEPISLQYFYDLVYIKKFKSIIDIGAQTGLYSLSSKFMPDVKFYAFEPYKPCFIELQKNCQLNGITNVEFFNLALGAETKTQIMHVCDDHLGLNTLGETPLRFDIWTDHVVNVTTIDEMFYDKEISVDIIKCDTEGYEYNIIKGAIKTIKKYHPDLFIEIFDQNCRQCGTTPSMVFDLLTSLNYKLISYGDSDNHHFVYESPAVP
jgi:FkbM family methyltransferase